MSGNHIKFILPDFPALRHWSLDVDYLTGLQAHEVVEGLAQVSASTPSQAASAWQLLWASHMDGRPTWTPPALACPGSCSAAAALADASALRLPALRRLDLSRNEQLGDAGVEALVRRPWPQLQELILRMTSVGSGGAAALPSAVDCAAAS